jgi:pimeloyl-ACP methyl ester carboxylesterase
VHQVVQALRADQLGQHFDKVVEVGHSLGSLVALTEAGMYKDVNALITTGIAHSLNYVNILSKVIAPDYPAVADPKFTSSGLDPAYLTSEPGTRKGFYNPANTDPNVIAKDEQLKLTGALIEAATLTTYNVLNVDRTLNIPVDDVVGQRDPFICGLLGPSCTSSAALASFERPFYGSRATVVGYLVPHTGHDIQLEKTAPAADKQMLTFCNRYVGHGNGATGTAPGHAPAVPTPPNPAPSLAARVINQVVITAVVPVLTAVQKASDVIPGVGSTVDPIPNMAALLAPVGNLVDRLVGTFPEGVLSGA